jgi:hypothetical protein
MDRAGRRVYDQWCVFIGGVETSGYVIRALTVLWGLGFSSRYCRILGCYTLSTGKYLPKFGRNIVSVSSEFNSQRRLYCCLMGNLPWKWSHYDLSNHRYMFVSWYNNILEKENGRSCGGTLRLRGTRWRSWLRHCSISRKVAGSIPNWNFSLT